MEIKKCTFNGPKIKFDKSALNSISKIADALAANAEALGELASTFSLSGLHIDPLVRVDSKPGIKIIED